MGSRLWAQGPIGIGGGHGQSPWTQACPPACHASAHGALYPLGRLPWAAAIIISIITRPMGLHEALGRACVELQDTNAPPPSQVKALSPKGQQWNPGCPMSPQRCSRAWLAKRAMKRRSHLNQSCRTFATPWGSSTPLGTLGTQCSPRFWGLRRVSRDLMWHTFFEYFFSVRTYFVENNMTRLNLRSF